MRGLWRLAIDKASDERNLREIDSRTCVKVRQNLQARCLLTLVLLQCLALACQKDPFFVKLRQVWVSLSWAFAQVWLSWQNYPVRLYPIIQAYTSMGVTEKIVVQLPAVG